MAYGEARAVPQGLTTGVVEPTLASIQTAQRQHIDALGGLVGQARRIAEHLLGAEPPQPDDGATASSSGAVYALHDNLMWTASLTEQIAHELRRIERALGVDKALVVEGYRSESIGGGLLPSSVRGQFLSECPSDYKKAR